MSGDTLWEISQQYTWDLSTIIAFNRMANPDYLLPEEVVLIPDEPFLVASTNIKIIDFFQWNNSLYVTGVARVFEATVSYALETKTGVVIDEGFTTATAGGPEWGEFFITITQIPYKK